MVLQNYLYVLRSRWKRTPDVSRYLWTPASHTNKTRRSQLSAPRNGHVFSGYRWLGVATVTDGRTTELCPSWCLDRGFSPDSPKR